MIHPEFCWRKEFLVVSLKDALDSPIDAKLKVSRVINITKPEVITFPLQDRLRSSRDGSTLPSLVEDEARDLCDQDAKPVREPEPTERSLPEIEKGMPIHDSSASAIHHSGWLGFLQHTAGKEGWFEFAECKVNLTNYTQTNVAAFPMGVVVLTILSGRLVLLVVKHGMFGKRTSKSIHLMRFWKRKLNFAKQSPPYFPKINYH